MFAGSSRLTACLCLLGLGSNFGVDHKRHKNAAGPIVVADLCTPEGVALLWSWLQNEQVLAIFLVPPCGSASRARQIPLKRKRFGHPAQGHHGPRPLRDDANVHGLPGLSDTDKQRVSLANQLVFLTAQIVQWAVENGVIVCVCGKSAVQFVLGHDLLATSCTSFGIFCFSFMSIWKFTSEENNVCVQHR